MREIKFRGKDLDGVWRHGSLVNNVFFYADTKKGVPYIFDVEDVDYSCLADLEDGEGFYELRPETVGQLTGYKDINDKDVWEGDIVKVTSVKEKTLGKVKYAQVDYDSDIAAWVLVTSEGKRGLLTTIDLCACIEVIGNIYDNPELLQQTTKENKK